MTPDERNMLDDLASKIANTPAPPRDAEAEDFIRTKIGNRPDALYLMTQTVVIQNLALQRAQQQIRDLQSRSGSPAQVSSGGSSWLGQTGATAGNPPQQQQPQYQAAPPPQAAAPAPSFGGGGGGFLRGAAQTAAGVAAGTLAAEAIGSMFSHPAGGFFGGGGGNAFAGGGFAPTEEVVNNYYDSPAPGDDRNNFADVNAPDAGSSQYDDNAQFDDGSQDDGSQFDDSSFDNGGFDGGSDDTLV